ncbi:MAG TPA: hypothetical protein VK973_05345, partial [Arenicellales bacterium]|nr:hypothetical protein [Arenicellales bacterium]
IFISLGVILAGAFVLNPLLIVLLKFVSDFATMSVSVDRVSPSPGPDRWQVIPLTTTGAGLAALLLLLNAVVYWAATNLLQLTVPQAQTVMFAWLAIGAGQAVLYVTRGRGFVWTRPYPSRWVVIATLLVIAVVSLMASRGWLMAPVPPSLIGALLLLALAFVVAGDLIKVALTRDGAVLRGGPQAARRRHSSRP